MTNQPASYSYDEIPYPSHPYEATHPDQLYTLARLFHMDVKLPDQARILELGGASGGNLIPMALQMPEAHFLGVDLSKRQIEEGQAKIESLGLKNIELKAIDFQSIDSSFGQFDYILCHGVFSWVPKEVQNRILAVCRERLSPTGVAYISYNAYPGWFMRGMIRQMMLHHIKNVAAPLEKIQQARGLLNFLVESTEGQTTPYAQILKQELEMLSKHSDAYLFHDHLEDNNHPMFFYEFLELAQANELQFLGESSLAGMVTSNLPPKAAEALTKLTDNLHYRSQYTDFVTNRMFRQSLLCHKGLKINRHIDESSLQGLRFSGTFQLENTEHVKLDNSSQELTAKCSNGRVIKTTNAALKTLFAVMSEAWPSSLPVATICERVEQRVAETIVVGQSEPVATNKVCATYLLQMMVRGDIDFRYLPDRFAARVAENPRVSGLSRQQAKSGETITTQKHTLMNADPFSRLIIQVLDGSKSRSDLGLYVGELISKGTLNVNVRGDASSVDMNRVHLSAVDKVLEQLRRAALLLD